MIPSVRNLKDLSYASTINTPYINLSYAHIGNLRALTDAVHSVNKKAVVNVELIGGFSLDKDGVKFLKQIFHVDVVIVSSLTRTNIIKAMGLLTIHRIMLMDSLSLENAERVVAETNCDAIELRPSAYGIKYLDRLQSKKTDLPFFLAGFIDSRQTIDQAKQLGFRGVSLSDKNLWNY